MSNPNERSRRDNNSSGNRDRSRSPKLKIIEYERGNPTTSYNGRTRPPLQDGTYFILCLVWPPGYCDDITKFCKTKPKNWLIHGLWLNKLIGGKVTYRLNCLSREELGAYQKEVNCEYLDPNNSEKAKEKSKNEMDTFIIELGAERGNDLRGQYMYEKHGSCIGEKDEVVTYESYLCIALKLATDLNLKSFFQDFEDEKKDQDGKYSLLSLSITFENKFHVRPMIFVKRPQNGGTDFISEIRVCYNDKLELVDCAEFFHTYKRRSQKRGKKEYLYYWYCNNPYNKFVIRGKSEEI